MCVPNATAIGSGVKLFSDIFSGISSIADGVDNSKYRSQVAINNAINAQNEGKRLEQLGIEESRKEKIAGIKNANKLAARNAASGFDTTSETNSYAYSDVLNDAYSNAQSVQDNYDYRAKSYFDAADDYLESARRNNKNTNNYLLNFAIQGLGSNKLVSNSWFNNIGG